MIVLRTFSNYNYLVEAPIETKPPVADRSPKILSDIFPKKLEISDEWRLEWHKPIFNKNKSVIQVMILKGGKHLFNSNCYGWIWISEHGRYPNRITLSYQEINHQRSFLTEKEIEIILKALINFFSKSKKFKILTVYDDGYRWTWACQNLKFYRDEFWTTEGEMQDGMSIKL